MSAKAKEQLTLRPDEASDETTEHAGERREVYLREGRTLSIDDGELLEVRSASGQLELRIRLTEDGPVLQMESAKLQLKATESIEIASKRVEITATETLQLKSENEIKADAEGEVRVNGKMIYLN